MEEYNFDYPPEQRLEDRKNIIMLNQLKLETPDPKPFLIEGLIKKQSLNIIHGATGCGKSLFVLKMIDDLTVGTDFLGKFPVVQTKTLLLDLEMTKDDCIVRAKNIVSSEDNSLILCEKSWKIDNVEQISWLTRVISSYHIGLVVFDTFSKIHNKDENSNSDITQVMTSLIDICNAYKVTILLLHHINKSKDATGLSRGRGASAIADNVGIYLDVKSKKVNDAFGNPYMIMTVNNEKSRRFESVNTFDISIKYDKITERTTFEYLGESMAAIDPINRAREEIVKLLENNPGTTRSRINEMLKEVAGRDAIKNAFG